MLRFISQKCPPTQQNARITSDLGYFYKTRMSGQAAQLAFTLAEVLITLGIIGVVAALTIPSLIQNHRKQVVENRLAKFYSVVNQAVKMSEAENGSIINWDNLIYIFNGDYHINTTTNGLEWYNKYLAKYINSVKVEETNTVENSIAVYFSDGSVVLISASSWIFYPHAKDFKTISYEAGFINRDIEQCGKLWFTFAFRDSLCPEKGLIPYGLCTANITEDTIKNHPALGCKKSSVTNERAYCTLMIARNGWKIPNDYPLRF